MNLDNEKTETSLEILLKKLAGKVEKIVSHISNEKISYYSSEIKDLKTMLECRNEREQFIKNIETHREFSATKFYFEEQIKEINEEKNKELSSNKTMKQYFDNEIKRTESIRSRLIEKCSNISTLSHLYGEFSTLLQSLTQHIAKCSDIANELTASSVASYTLDDLILLVKGQFVHRQKELFIKTIIGESKRVLFTSRNQIILNCLSMIENDLMETNKQHLPEAQFLPTEAEKLDENLVSIAKNFGVDDFFDETNAQKFLYFCDKKFTDVWNGLAEYSVDKVKNTMNIKKYEKTMEEICDNAFISSVPIEETVENYWDFIIDKNFDKIINTLKEESSNYDHFVNGHNYQKNAVLKRKKQLQSDRVLMLGKMRICRAKYLIYLICSVLNQFEAIKANLFGAHYKWRKSKQLKHLIEVLDETGKPVFFDTAEKEFIKIRDNILHVVSYYITQYNEKSAEQKLNQGKLIDKTHMIYKIIEKEFNYINAKRLLVQSLYECSCQDKDDKVVDTILKVISRRPILHINMFYTANIGYNISIKKLQRIASTIQTIVKLQVFHERCVSTGLDSSVPLFDRICDAPDKKVMFAEGVPISPLEHFYLRRIPKLINIVDEMARELADETDIQTLKFFDYVELSYWNVFSSRVFKLAQYVSYTIQSYPYINELSNQANSLITAPVLSDLSKCLKLINSVTESRRLRFTLNLLVFMNICWKLQEKLIQSDALQDIYISQSSRCGFNDPKIYMENFKKAVKEGSVETFSSERILELAYVDYEHYEFDFMSNVQLKRYIQTGKFQMIEEMYTFQKLHNFILNVAIRYNQCVLDNDLIVDHFGLALEESSDLFLTAADNMIQENGNFVRSFMSSAILFDSEFILDNYKKAQEDREMYYVNIRSIKHDVRMEITAQANGKEISPQDYINEMIDAFSASAFRYELAFVCRITRHLLLMNSFCDAFILEPTSILLVTELGRAQNHYVIPLWSAVFRYCRSAPIQRQSSIFKMVLNHVAYIYRMVQLVRFECSLPQEKKNALTSLLENQFKMESSIPQRIFNELNGTPGGTEYDFCFRYIENKTQLLELRMELAVLQCIDSSFLTNESKESKLRDNMHKLYILMKEETKNNGMSSLRYTPKWPTLLFSEAQDSARNELGVRLTLVDKDIEVDLQEKQLHSAVDSSSSLNESIDFLLVLLSQINLKYAFIQLHNGVFDFKDPFEGISIKQFFDANSIWVDELLPTAHKLLIPKEEEDMSIIYLKKKIVDQKRFFKVQVEVLRDECDNHLLAKQIKDTKEQIHQIPNILSLEKNIQKVDPTDLQLESSPKDIDTFFTDDLKKNRTELVKKVCKAVDDSVIETNNSVYKINSDKLEESLKNLTCLLYSFSKYSFEDQTSLWYTLIKYILNIYNENEEDKHILSLYEKSVKERFTDMFACKSSNLLYQSILKINEITRMINEREKEIVYEDESSENDVRNDLVCLVFDLRNQNEIVKSKFVQMRDFMYNRVQERIKVANNMEFTVSKNFLPQKNINKGALKEKQEEIDALKKKIILMRVIRCMSSIAARRFYLKRIRTNENDSKYESAKLWETKREFEVTQQNAVAELQKYYESLADNEIEIEKTKQMIENEKQNTIQLVHWKATNMKKEEKLVEELKKFQNADKTNINKLLAKLEKANETLEELKESNEELREIHERDIIRPLTSIDNTRRKIALSRIDQLNLSMKCYELKTTKPDTTMQKIATLRNENVLLKTKNKTLRMQIEEIESTKEALPKKIKESIEEIKPSPRIEVKKKPKSALIMSLKTPKRQAGIKRPITAVANQKPRSSFTTIVKRRRKEEKFQYI